jgi:hypothetical protein
MKLEASAISFFGRYMISNKLFRLLFLILTIVFIQPTNSQTSEKELKGWAGSPEEPAKIPFDYYYITVKGKASSIAMRKQKGDAIKATCIAAAEAVAGNEIMKVSSSVKSGDNGEVVSGKVNLKQKECKSSSQADPKIELSEWKECECIFYSHLPHIKKNLE